MSGLALSFKTVSSLPAAGAFDGQTLAVAGTGNLYVWSGAAWVLAGGGGGGGQTQYQVQARLFYAP